MATLKQRRAIKIISENPRKPVGKAMREAGYSKESSERPQDLTTSKGFREYFGELFTPQYLRKKHDELLNAKRVDNAPFYHKITDEQIKEIMESQGFKFIGVKRFMSDARVYFISPDYMARDKALDKAFKLLGRYAQLEGGTGNNQFDNLSLEELDEKLAELEEYTSRAKKFRKLKKKSK